MLESAFTRLARSSGAGRVALQRTACHHLLAGVIGFVEYPIYVLQSGLAPLPLATTSTDLNFCIAANGTLSTPTYSGRLVSLLAHLSGTVCCYLLLLLFPCLEPRVTMLQCDAISGNLRAQEWKLRTSFPVYVIALSASVGEASRLPSAEAHHHQVKLCCCLPFPLREQFPSAAQGKL